MFVLVHVEDKSPQSGLYVAIPGMEKSYTPKLQHADIFSTRVEAEQHQCKESEVVVPITSLLKGLRP